MLPMHKNLCQLRPTHSHFRALSQLSSRGHDSSCPFEILGVRKSSSYENVKKAFLKLALLSHPDVPSGRKEDFVRYHSAFKLISEGLDGVAVSRKSKDDQEGTGMSDENFHQWFHYETGLPLSKDLVLDSNLLKEVAQVTENMAQGGLDKGGMWQLAASIREKVKRGDIPPSQLSSGSDRSSNGLGRRRRNRGSGKYRK